MKIKNLLIMLVIVFVSIAISTKVGICTVLGNSETIIESNSLYSEIILPPGSTSADLQTAINNAVSEDTIIISSNMECTAIVTIPAGKEITIRVRYRKFLDINDNFCCKTF